MTDWTSVYGKPIELFLALHLATMMPDLTYDLATSFAFNTKVNIELQEVNSTFNVIYRKSDGTEISQTDIQDIYVRVMCNLTNEQINRFIDNGTFEEATKKIISGIQSYKTSYFNVEEGGSVSETDITTKKGFNFSKIEEELLGQAYGRKNVTVQNGPTFTTKEFDEYIAIVDLNNSNEVAAAQAILDGTSLAGITVEQLEELKNLVVEGQKSTTAYLPRIGSVVKHWYYNDISYDYGLAARAKKRVQYTVEDEDDPLQQSKLNGASIILDTIYTAADGGGVYYQLAEPEAQGPNPAIVALFKGGSGSVYGGATYNFTGKYYRYDGTRLTAQKIANSKALAENGVGGTYYFQGYNDYPVTDTPDMVVQPQEVTFTTEDDNGNETKDDAMTAFAILENVHSVEAESVYRMLKELVITLGYFTKEDFMKPLTQVLLWPVERVGSDTEEGSSDDEMATQGIVKKEGEYGLFLTNGVAVNSGDTIIAPGDATVVSVDGDTIRLRFKTISDGNATALQEKFGSDYKEVDRNIVLDMEMTIKGINASVSSGDVTAGSVIGTATNDDMQILLYDMNKTIVDEIETYMYPTYKGTRMGIFETLKEKNEADQAN